RIFGPGSHVDETDEEQHQPSEEVGEARPIDFFERDEDLGVERLEESKVEAADANEVADVLAIRHEEGLDDAVDEHRRGQEGEKFPLAPAGVFSAGLGVVKDEEIEA